MQKTKIIRMMQLALLTAIVIVFQILASSIPIGTTRVSLVLIPIVVGAVSLGPLSGGFLGLVFGIITLLAGATGADPFTNVLFNAQPVATALICLGKGTFAGVGAGYVYKLFKNKDKVVAAFLAAAAAPVINTGLFILGGLTLVSGTLQQSNYVNGTTLVYFLVIGCAGLNFVAEFILNIIVAPAINTIVNAISHKIK